MKTPRLMCWFGMLVLLALSAWDAFGDEGAIVFRVNQDPFAVTIFCTPQPTAGSPMDVSVLVQRRDFNGAVLDADVDLTFIPPGTAILNPAEPICGMVNGEMPGLASQVMLRETTVPATHRQASNKLLYAASVQPGTPGTWSIHAVIRAGDDRAKFHCQIQVGGPSGRLSALLPYLLLPPLLVSLFSLNQHLQNRRSTRESTGASNVA